MYIIKLNKNNEIVYEIRSNMLCFDILSSNGWITDRYLLDKYFDKNTIFIKYLENSFIDLEMLNFTYDKIMLNQHIYNDSKYHLDILVNELSYCRSFLNLVHNNPNNIHFVTYNNWSVIDRYIESEMKRTGVKEEEYTRQSLSRIMSRIGEYWERDHVEFVNNEIRNLYTNIQNAVNSIEILSARKTL